MLLVPLADIYPLPLTPAAGDVLEALKSQHVVGNGGLIVTCLLDDLGAASSVHGTTPPAPDVPSGALHNLLSAAVSSKSSVTSDRQGSEQLPPLPVPVVPVAIPELVAKFEWRSSPLAGLEPPPALKARGCPDHVFGFLQLALVL